MNTLRFQNGPAVEDWIERARAADIVDIARGLQPKLKRVGSSWVGPCPSDCARADGFAVTPSKGVFICRPSGAAGDAISMVMHALGCGFNEACAHIVGEPRPGNKALSFDKGLRRQGERADHFHEMERRRAEANAADEADEGRRRDAALAIWRSTVPADRTPVATYLTSRGINLSPPDVLRFHPGLKHPSGSIFPAMIALVTRGTDSAPIGIHRTYLSRDGVGKAPLDPAKMMLGPCRGGVVRLGEPGNVLMLGEGIETSLAALHATGKPTWSALSTSGLRGLDLPDDVRDVIVLADGDDPGEAAARDCARRWKLEGRRVRIARPPQGLDFSDMLVAGAPSTKRGTS